MSNNWHPKPLRPKDPSPLFRQDDSFVVRPNASLTPMQRQRIQDGTQHTRGSQHRILPTQAAQNSGPVLYLGGDDVSKSESCKEKLDPDDVVKSFLAKGCDPAEEDTAKGADGGVGGKIGAAAGKVVGTAGKVAGKVVGTAVGLATRN